MYETAILHAFSLLQRKLRSLCNNPSGGYRSCKKEGAGTVLSACRIMKKKFSCLLIAMVIV